MKMVMCPLVLSFGMTRPLCNMKPESACQLFVSEFRVVAEQISTRDLVQEYLANRTSLTLSEWSIPKLKGTNKTLELVRLPYRFKFEKRRSINDCSLRHPTKMKVESGNGCSKF
jgi:hypothetical protein